jgi:hypothetical protein
MVCATPSARCGADADGNEMPVPAVEQELGSRRSERSFSSDGVVSSGLLLGTQHRQFGRRRRPSCHCLQLPGTGFGPPNGNVTGLCARDGPTPGSPSSAAPRSRVLAPR